MAVHTVKVGLQVWSTEKRRNEIWSFTVQENTISICKDSEAKKKSQDLAQQILVEL